MLITLFNSEVKTLKIQDFIDGRNVTYAAVFQYIKRNKEMFSGHIGKTNKIELDETAVQLLEGKYPYPHPVQVVHDEVAREKLQEMTEKYAAVMEKVAILTEQNAQLLVIQAKQRFLEEENRDLVNEVDNLQRELQRAEKALEMQKNSYEFLQEQLKIAELNYKIEKEKSWWKKLIKL